jgi:hypothetical protein
MKEMSEEEKEQLPYVCVYPGCGAKSWHPMDIKQQYCGRCHRWAVDLHNGGIPHYEQRPVVPEPPFD